MQSLILGFRIFISSSFFAFKKPFISLQQQCHQHFLLRTASKRTMNPDKAKRRQCVISCLKINSSIIHKTLIPCGACISTVINLVEVCRKAYPLSVRDGQPDNHYSELDRPFLGVRRIENGVAKEYVWQSHRQVRTRIENYAKGLTSLGLQRQKCLGVYSVNRPEWVCNKG